MKKISFILLCLFFFFVSTVSNAAPRETDFAPFPLSLKTQRVLDGNWKSEKGQIKISKIDNSEINEHSWYTVSYESFLDTHEEEVIGFIYFDLVNDEYKKVFWSSAGVETKELSLFFLVEDQEAMSQGFECLKLKTYMIKIKDESFTKSECSL